MSNWKSFHYVCYAAVALLVFEPSYIHPDEHFQSLEVLYRDLYGASTNVPWEFGEVPSRSAAVLWACYGPLLKLLKWAGVHPLGVLYLLRLQLAITYIFVLHFSTRILSGSRQSSAKALFLVLGSYVTWTYQSHTFSNSIETQLVLIVLSLLKLIELGNSSDLALCSLVSALTAFGIFNRVTFPAFIALPGLPLLTHFIRYPKSAIVSIVSFGLTCYLLVLADTRLFQSKEYVITPLNNLLYNSSYENLAQHGIHPRYTHVLVNLPQLLGPLILLLPGLSRSITTYSLVSALLFLSVIPHQELRFLTPIIPLFSISVKLDSKYIGIIIKLWIAFNMVMGVVIGVLHQRGVLVVLDHLRETKFDGVQFWWKTYSPPGWILNSPTIQYNKGKENALYDLMGMGIKELSEKISGFNNSILITSRSSSPLIKQLNGTNNLTFTKNWHYNFHLDLDHIDFSDLTTLQPGIDIYNIIN